MIETVITGRYLYYQYGMTRINLTKYLTENDACRPYEEQEKFECY